MSEAPTSPPSDAEMRQLKLDAAHNVADAHDSLRGDLEALAKWRAQRETQASID